jgi:hypothetical protein
VGRLASGRRYLDKAPRNSLRVPYLAELFPTARFVHVQRDGRAAVSSLITGWRDRTGMFPAFALPVPLAVTGYAGTGWHFILPPGWRAYAEGRTLAEVCAFQWTSANEAILDARDRLGGDRWLQVRYEDLVEHPEAEAAALLEGLGLPVDERVLAFARDLDRHHTRTVTAPERDKWRRENPEEIGTILGQIEPTMRRLGYPVDPVKR